MSKELVGKVSVEEKNEIMQISERLLGINELMATLYSGLTTESESERLLEKLIEEAGKAKRREIHWWNSMKDKYNWSKEGGETWYLDYETCEVFYCQ